MAPVEPWKKVLVDKAFLETGHGSIMCDNCHGGNSRANTVADAHIGVRRDPSFPDATAACGDCHEGVTEPARTSFHYTLAAYKQMILKRASRNPKVVSQVDPILENHCYYCHSSCGQCHVSRPDSVEGGFIQGHRFNKKPDMEEQCTACHGSRIGNEYLGKTDLGDVHFTKKHMDCIACHGNSLHNDFKPDMGDRYDAAGLPSCETCHPSDGGIEAHTIHRGKVQCQVCHSQEYANCFDCHVGKDSKGIPYYQNRSPVLQTFKIGLNPGPDKHRPEKWVVLRRVPVNPGIFDYYIKDALTDFNALPTWKYATPHNIQRRTYQNRECDNCHGNVKLFLTEKDVKFMDANGPVIVPEDRIPAKLGERKKKRKKSIF